MTVAAEHESDLADIDLTENSRERNSMERKKQLTSRIEPFDSFWEAPDDIEKGYRNFGLFYTDNYARYFPSDKASRILCVSCGPGYLVNLLTEKG